MTSGNRAPFCKLAAFAVGTYRLIHVLLMAVAATLVYLGAPLAATAAPITYELVGVTATFGSDVDTLTGNYTFDPSGPTLDSVDITVSGPVGSGSYTNPASPVNHNLISAVALNSSQFIVESLQMQLANGFGMPFPSDVLSVTIVDCFESFGCGLPFQGTEHDTVVTTGQSVPVATPIPATLPLCATGLDALGLFGLRRRRKAQAVAA